MLVDVVPEFLLFLLVKSPSCGGKFPNQHWWKDRGNPSRNCLLQKRELQKKQRLLLLEGMRQQKKSKKHFHSSALPSKPQQKVADKIRQATLQDQFLICGWSPSYQTQNSTPCVPQQMSGPSGPNSPHIPTPEISPWLNLDTQPELRFPGHDLPIFHSKFPPISLANFPTPSAAEFPAIIRLITPCHTEPQDASQGIGFLQYSVWIVHHTWNCDCRHPKGSNLAQLGDI